MTGSPGQPGQITGPGLAVQAKFGQYLQDAKNPRSISQIEKAVEQEQIRSNEQILPTPALKCSKYLGKFRSLSQIHGKTTESNISPTALINLSPIGKIGSYHEALKSVCTVLKSNA